ncbi:MAG: FAD synthetase family protein [Spirochaetota bacterium]|nr:MAG: FAD synthetase family protein [Spirochaetota bacterium]
MYIVERIKRVGKYYGKIGLTIGNFDGYHLGHQRIVETLIHECKKRDLFTAVITFKQHPLKVIRGNEPVKIGARIEKLKWFIQHGIDLLFYIDFSEDFSSTSPSDFLHTLKKELDPRLYCLGKSFRFGNDNEGNIDLMKKYVPLLHYQLISIEDVTLGGKAVSSTRIRKAIKKGDFKLVTELLGRNYSVFLKADQKDQHLLAPFLSNVALPNNGEYSGKLVNLRSHQKVDERVKVSGSHIESNEVRVKQGTLYRFIFDDIVMR